MRAVFLLGPTASGKSALALALSEHFPVEIVSMDSAQVYRGMDVGTAKPDREARERVPHHLVDILEPREAYSAGRFRDDALGLIAAIGQRGKIPILAGGTMLYFRALTRGLAQLPPAQPGIRHELAARAVKSGWPALHAELARVDPATAARVEPTDWQRIQRALEVHRVTGRPLSQLHAEGSAGAPALDALTISLEPSDRGVLHQRIAARFRAMLAAGLVEELEGLRRHYMLDASMPSMRAVGYRQAWETLEGRAPAQTLEARGIAATRQLAKRQLTWLRTLGGAAETLSLHRFDCLRSDVARAAGESVERFLEAQSSP